MPNVKRIGGGPWKNGQKSDDLTWNDPGVLPSITNPWVIFLDNPTHPQSVLCSVLSLNSLQLGYIITRLVLARHGCKLRADWWLWDVVWFVKVIFIVLLEAAFCTQIPGDMC